MALTTTEENQLRELLRRSNATQNGKLASNLAYKNGLQTIHNFIVADGNNLVRANGLEVANMLTTSNVTTGNPSKASPAYNHLMTRDATRSEITRITNPMIDDARAIGQAAQTAANNAQNSANTANSRANDAHTQLQNTNNIVSSNTGSINELRKKMLSGWTEGLVMDFGALPSGTGAVTVTFNRRFLGTPIVIVNFWGDIGNPRFSLAQEDNYTWGIRLSANYPGVWAVIGIPA